MTVRSGQVHFWDGRVRAIVMQKLYRCDSSIHIDHDDAEWHRAGHE